MLNRSAVSSMIIVVIMNTIDPKLRYNCIGRMGNRIKSLVVIMINQSKILTDEQ